MASQSRTIATGRAGMGEMTSSINSASESLLRAEKATLGGILLDAEAWSSVSAALAPQDFSLDTHQRIYSAMCDLVADGKSIDIVTLGNQLGKSKALEAVGGFAYISTLTEGVPRRESLTHHLDIIRDRSKFRQVQLVAERALLADQSCSGDELASQLASDLEAIEAQTVDEEETTIEQDVMDTLNEIELESRSKRDMLGISLCVPELDRTLCGLRKHELLIIGALPERGKTAFAMQIARANAASGDRVDFYSWEMSKQAVMRRNLASIAKVLPSKIREPRELNPVDKRNLQDAGAYMATLPFQIHKPRGMTPAKFVAKMRLQVHRHRRELAEKEKLHLIIIDHLKAFSFCCPGQDERHRMNFAIETLRRFKEEEDVAMIVLHHLKRHDDINAIPTMQDFKESGDIEAAGDALLALHREEENSEFTGRDLAIFVKMRSGEKGPIQVTFDKKTLEYLPDYEPRPTR